MHKPGSYKPSQEALDRYAADVSAAAQRKRVFAEAAEHGYWVGGAHLSFPGIGHLRAAGTGYTYVHANYSSLLLDRQ